MMFISFKSLLFNFVLTKVTKSLKIIDVTNFTKWPNKDFAKLCIWSKKMVVKISSKKMFMLVYWKKEIIVLDLLEYAC